jgi:hypothetical protein
MTTPVSLQRLVAINRDDRYDEQPLSAEQSLDITA